MEPKNADSSWIFSRRSFASSSVMAPVFRSASMAICLPGMASSVKRAVTSDTRSEPLLITSSCIMISTKNTMAPTIRLPPPTKLPNVSTTLPACPERRIFLVELTFSESRNRVMISSNVGKLDISSGSFENNDVKRMIMERTIFKPNKRSSSNRGTGIIRHKIGTNINTPSAMSCFFISDSSFLSSFYFQT